MNVTLCTHTRRRRGGNVRMRARCAPHLSPYLLRPVTGCGRVTVTPSVRFSHKNGAPARPIARPRRSRGAMARAYAVLPLMLALPALALAACPPKTPTSFAAEDVSVKASISAAGAGMGMNIEVRASHVTPGSTHASRA